MKNRRQTAVRTGLAFAAAFALVFAIGLLAKIGVGQSGSAPRAPVVPPPPPQPIAAVVTQPQPPAPPPLSPNVQIIFNTSPSTHASVTWGRTRLGFIAPRQPLVVTRPRDSGPLDVMIRASGYLPVQTRAYTYSDARITVKLTTPDDESTLLGYRQPLDAGTPLLEEAQQVQSTDPAAPPTPAP